MPSRTRHLSLPVAFRLSPATCNACRADTPTLHHRRPIILRADVLILAFGGRGEFGGSVRDLRCRTVRSVLGLDYWVHNNMDNGWSATLKCLDRPNEGRRDP